jgi:hypothetical protein
VKLKGLFKASRRTDLASSRVIFVSGFKAELWILAILALIYLFFSLSYSMYDILGVY